MAMPDIPKPPQDPREVTAVDLRYTMFYLFFFFCVYIIASFGVIAEA
ncbi:MAG TPA: hypothetical protein VEI97_16610 [bacterium]|nr:hypothetical protein [bacterium]